MGKSYAVQGDDPEISPGDAETSRLLDSLRSKGYRVGGVQAVFGLGDAPGHIRYVVNGTPLDRDQLRALDKGRLKLSSAPRAEDRGPNMPLAAPKP